MVQGKNILVILVESLYLTISIMTLTYAYYYLSLDTGDWIALFSLLIFMGIFALTGLSEVLKFLDKPKLKIVNSSVKVHNEGSEGEFKDTYFVIRNVGAQEAQDCVIKVRIKEIWQDFYSLPETPFDVYPDDERGEYLSQIVRSDGKMFIKGTRKDPNYPPLPVGRVYTLEVRFYGRNFKDRKVHALKLNLSSWESIGIQLDCWTQRILCSFYPLHKKHRDFELSFA